MASTKSSLFANRMGRFDAVGLAPAFRRLDVLTAKNNIFDSILKSVRS